MGASAVLAVAGTPGSHIRVVIYLVLLMPGLFCTNYRRISPIAHISDWQSYLSRWTLAAQCSI